MQASRAAWLASRTSSASHESPIGMAVPCAAIIAYTTMNASRSSATQSTAISGATYRPTVRVMRSLFLPNGSSDAKLTRHQVSIQRPARSVGGRYLLRLWNKIQNKILSLVSEDKRL